ncbi:hypothetical protein KJ966_00435 [bacterium]|nr:hypothetical protein [bacterium]
MSKKKDKKRKNKQINPHKLSENELKGKINELLNRNQIDESYSLVKVLLERFESKDSVSLFQTTLNKKIKNLESLGKSEEAARLIAEAKKRFSSSFFREADEFVQLQSLDDDQLINYFCNKETIPELFRYQIADILYFSDKNNRSFIKKHTEYKDVFYVKEAFQNGYNPVDTPKLLTGLKPTSPYKPWYLLHKAIQAFQVEDLATLELVDKKLTSHSFPSFLVSRLFNCQRYLNGQISDTQKISADDLEIFKTLCGESCPTVFVLSNLVKQQTANPLYKLISRLRWFERNQPGWYPDILQLCLTREASKESNRYQDNDNLPKLLVQIRLPDTLAINKTHLIIKLSNINTFHEWELEDIIYELVESEDIDRIQIFNPKHLKAELLFFYAKSLRPPGKSSRSLSSRMLNRFDPDESQDNPVRELEKALKLSDHNPKIFTLLIDYYLKTKEKTSTVNKVVDSLLEKYPSNPEGYELAGKIAFRNKSFTKAISYFEKAKELMPLNRDFLETILDCFEGIIDKRYIKNAQLIDKDLENAKVYLNHSNSSALFRYKLLEAKALLKKYALAMVSNEEVAANITSLYGEFSGNNKAVFKLVLLLLQATEYHQKLVPVQNQILHQIKATIEPKLYLVFLKHAVNGVDSPISEYFRVVSDLTIEYLKKEKEEKTLSINQHRDLIKLTITESWYKTFIAFVCLARHCYPNNQVFAFLETLILKKVSHGKIREFFRNEEVIEWFLTPAGKKVVEDLGMMDDTFEEIDSVMRSNRELTPSNLLFEIDNLIKDYPIDFQNFSSYLIEDSHSDEMLSLKEVKKIFGFPIRITAAPYSSNNDPGSLFYNMDSRENQRKLKELERQRIEEEKKWEEEQEQKKKNRETQARKKREIEEKIAELNDQIDIFDFLNNEEV